MASAGAFVAGISAVGAALGTDRYDRFCAGCGMTAVERQHLRTLVSRQRERAEIREALAMSHARSSIDRMLGEELIAAGREVVTAWHERRNSEHRVAAAIARLEELVGKP